MHDDHPPPHTRTHTHAPATPPSPAHLGALLRHASTGGRLSCSHRFHGKVDDAQQPPATQDEWEDGMRRRAAHADQPLRPILHLAERRGALPPTESMTPAHAGRGGLSGASRRPITSEAPSSRRLPSASAARRRHALPQQRLRLPLVRAACRTGGEHRPRRAAARLGG